MVWLKKHKMKYISTYEDESRWAGVLGLGIEFGLALTGKFNEKKKNIMVRSRDCTSVLLLPKKKKRKDHKYNL